MIRRRGGDRGRGLHDVACAAGDHQMNCSGLAARVRWLSMQIYGERGVRRGDACSEASPTGCGIGFGDAAGRAKVRTGAAGASQLKSFTRETPETTALTVAGTGDFVKLSGVGGRAGRARAWPTLGFAPTKQHRPAGRCLKHRPVGLSRCIDCDFAEEGILRAPSLHQKLPQCGLLLALLGRALRLGRRSRLGGLGGGLGGLSSGLLGSGHGHRFLPKIRTPFEHSGGLLGSPRGEDRVDLRTRCTATQVKTTGDIRVAKAARHPIRRKEAAPTVAVTECEPLPGVRHVRQ